MRIAMISPLDMRVPPVGYGGTELVVSLLTEELARKGHDVTLFASGDSITAARLEPGSSTFLRGSGRPVALLNTLNVIACYERHNEFDIIHNHTLDGMAPAGLISTPVLTTLHGAMEGDWLTLFLRYRGWHNAISASALSRLPRSQGSLGVIYNAIDVDSYPFNPGQREDFALYLSRISVEKGTHNAIAFARRANQPLVIAGNVDDVDREYFERDVAPYIDGTLVRYVGEADSIQKRALLRKAKCLVAPITWEEPFGLFLVEAMACGTPVLAFGRGAVPEIIADGVTGFIVDSVEQMADALRRLGRIDPHVCRREAEERFGVARMADDYINAYKRVIEPAERPLQLQAIAPPTLTA